MNHVTTWVAQGPPDLQVELHEVVHNTDTFDQLTSSLLAARVDPNFIAPLREYELSIMHLRKKKKERTLARKEYDKARELLRLVEADKKSKKDKIEQTRAKHDESKRRYDQANADFIQSVHAVAAERRTTLANPFRDLAGIFAQYVRAITSRATVEISPSASEHRRSVGAAEGKRKTLILTGSPDFAALAASLRSRAPVALRSEVIDDGFINPVYGATRPEEIDDGWMSVFNPVGRAEGWEGLVGAGTM
jgi:hypothetical protein